MKATDLDFNKIVPEIDKILARGLSHGVGKRDGQMCIEAAICTVLGLPHGDDPKCVAKAVRRFKIRLNDSNWSSPHARAQGLRDLGIAQLGSLGVVNDVEFARQLARKTIGILLPKMVRDLFPDRLEMMKAADECEKNPGYKSAKTLDAAAAAYAAYAADAADAAAAYAAYAADAADAAAAYAAYAAAAAAAYAADAYAADAAAAAKRKQHDPDFYLKLSASFALEVLTELKSPGALWLLESRREVAQ